MTDKKTEKIYKISRGYRLRKETHRLIEQIRSHIGKDQDSAIAAACEMYYNELKKNNDTHTLQKENIQKDII
jgi:hypothetical protein